VKPLISESPRKLSRIASPKPESGDKKDVLRHFGIRESHLYDLVKRGLVETVLIPGRGKTRGKRLFKFASIRKLLAAEQKEAQS